MLKPTRKINKIISIILLKHHQKYKILREQVLQTYQLLNTKIYIRILSIKHKKINLGVDHLEFIHIKDLSSGQITKFQRLLWILYNNYL
jgi:hypothetical protein